MKIATTGIEIDISQATASRAHYATSFSPEKRGAQAVDAYTSAMRELAAYIESQAKDDRQQEIAQELFDRLRSKYRAMFSRWLAAKSRCMSSMITGPSNFPVHRAQKANRNEHNRLDELFRFQDAMKRYVDNAMAGVYSKAEKIDGELEAMKVKLSKAEADQAFMKDANALLRKKDMDALESLFSSRYGAGTKRCLEAFLKPNYMGHIGYERWQLSNNLANIKRMQERVAILEKKSAASGEEAKEQALTGLTIVRNTAEDRLQLIFDGKPDDGERAILKRNGFKWSPRFGAWQRQLNGNAEYAMNECVLKNPLFAKYAASA